MPASLRSNMSADCVGDRNPNSFGPQTVCTTSRSSRTIPSMSGCSPMKCWQLGWERFLVFQSPASHR